MYKRFELHNHTIESDGSLSVKELIDYMVENEVDVFALTDHNTISGHHKVKEILEKEKPPIECIFGMEYTTYYGHILCFNLNEYIPWENIDKERAELLFRSIKKTGALAGIAHPFSYGAPVAQGCRWEMKLNDYSVSDFIEIINNPESLEANAQALMWWQSLCLKGMRISMTAGMDLHRKNGFENRFAVYIKTRPDLSAQNALARAIKTQKTYVTRGPVFEALLQKNAAVKCRIENTVKKGFDMQAVPFWTIEYTSPSGSLLRKLDKSDKTALFSLSEFKDSSVIVVKLYAGDACMENLTAVAPVIYR